MVLMKRGVLKLVIAALALAAAGCQGSPPTPTVAPTRQPTPTEEVTNIATSGDTEITIKGVRLGIQVPVGWEVQNTEDGLLMAEHFGPMDSGTMVYGMQIHLFVHTMTDGQVSGKNIAWSALKAITTQPSYIGKARVSEPKGFDWDNHDAAYYLVNNGDGNLMLVIGVALADSKRMVVCNVTSRVEKVSRIRTLVPQVLRSLTVDGTPMEPDDLMGALPDPLVFPGYNR
jgi:hypothetical protein